VHKYLKYYLLIFSKPNILHNFRCHIHNLWIKIKYHSGSKKS